MKSTNKLSSLGITLDDLYERKSQIIIHLADKPHQYHVILVDKSGRPDCKISSWSANLWARTKKGMSYQKYNSLSTLQTALIRLVDSKIETKGDITFTLSKEVMTI